MRDPSQVLGVPPGADERIVRQRYLQLVRENPPERSAERFAEIQTAYDALRDPVRRLEQEIFSPGRNDSLQEIIVEVQHRLRRARIPVAALLSLAETNFEPNRWNQHP